MPLCLLRSCRGFHVDEYGYVHNWQNEVGMQHYLCGVLMQHYKQALQVNALSITYPLL